MTNLSDRELVKLFKGEHRESVFNLLIDRYSPLVYSSAVRQLNDRTTAEDVAQAVFIVLWNKGGSLRNGSAMPAWLLSVTRLACLDAIKRKSVRDRHEHEVATMPSPDVPVDYNALAANLDEALNGLRAEDRTAVALRYLEGQSFQNVATALDISPDAAKKRVARALSRLRQHLAKRGLTRPADVLESGMAGIAMVPIPATLIPAIHAARHGHASVSVTALSKGVQSMLSFSSMKLGGLAVAAVLIIAGVIIIKTLDQGGRMNGNSMVMPLASTKQSTQPAGKATSHVDNEIFIGGDVQRSGVYSIKDNSMNLLQSVFAAVPDEEINLGTAQLVLIRKIDGQKEIRACYSLQDLMDCKIDPPVLQGGDEVEVSKERPPDATDALAVPAVSPTEMISTVVYIGGKVKRPGVYSIKDNPTNIAQLFRSAALDEQVNVDLARVTLIRRTGPGSSQKSSYSLKDLTSGRIELPLQGGDIVWIYVQ